MHKCTKYKVSMFNPVGDACADTNDTDTNANADIDEARRTKHDCIRLFG